MEVVVMNVAQQTAETNSAAHHARAGLGSTLFRVAWLAILLGFAMEALLLLFTAGFEILPGLGPMVAELIGKVSWSAIVCAGLALGTAASKARAPFMGLLGFLFAPLAFHISRTLQQGVAKTLEVAAAGAGTRRSRTCRGNTLRRGDRKLHVLDGSGATGRNRPLLPQCERDPLSRGLLSGSVLRDGFGGASRAMRPKAF